MGKSCAPVCPDCGRLMSSRKDDKPYIYDSKGCDCTGDNMKYCEKCKRTFEESEDEHVLNWHIEEAGVKDAMMAFIEKYITEVEQHENGH